MSPLNYRREVLDSSPYVPDWMGLDRHDFMRLDRNECTRPLSPAVADAISTFVHERGVESYPESDALLPQLAEYCGVTTNQLLLSNGSERGLDLILHCFLTGSDTMLVARPEFPVFGHVAGLIGADVDGVPFGEDLEFPYDEFRQAATKRPQLIVLINPNNPTGTMVEQSFIVEMLETYPDIPVLVDEAYVEFTGQSAVPLLDRYANLIVLRSFSKVFALAGLRLGYIVSSPETIFELSKLRNPFEVNQLAVVAAAAQLSDIDVVRANAERVMNITKPKVVSFFESAGVRHWRGAANFMVVRPDDCADVVAFLRENRILVRTQGNRLAGTFRMSLGTDEEMDRFIDVYRAYLAR